MQRIQLHHKQIIGIDRRLFIPSSKEINFIRPRIKGSPSQNTYLVTMDVVSLYPNIDHSEGLIATKESLDRRISKEIPTATLCDITQFILNSNTMHHEGKFYHQIKGCAMGTNMAVNYANIFMEKFENDMLRAYEEKYKKRPELWLRFIDDIFFIWRGDAQSLKTFVDFCNNFAQTNGYKSNITFTSHCSSESVDFLDIKISICKDKIKTELFNKPTAAHLYVHRMSDHPHHIIKSSPKSQFLRIRRICSELSDYKKYANQFLNFYRQRGYNTNRLKIIISEVQNMNRDELLNTTEKTKKHKQERVPLVINWHHKFSKLPSILNNTYREIVHKFPDFAKTFPAPPLISFRRNKTFKDILCAQNRTAEKRSRITTRCTKANETKRGRPCELCPSMSEKDKITNAQTKTSIFTQGGTCTSHHIIYAAECTRCNLIYIGSTTQLLNRRMNGHRHDAKERPKATELAEHFFKNPHCNFDTDIKITIIENIENATITQLERREDYWISKLSTRKPTGLNFKANSEVLSIRHSVFW